MKRMKRTVCILLALALTAALFAGCGATRKDTGKRSIVVTIFPIYDWIVNLLGEQAGDWDVTFLLDNGVDLHSYQPTADDIVRISSCDLFVCVGGLSDAWVADATRGSVNPDMRTVKLMQVLGDAAKAEEIVEGMEPEEEEEEEEGEVELDEHVWLSVRNAARFVRAIADELAALDEAHADVYAANCQSYCEKLTALDEAFAEVVAGAARTTVLFGDRFPFRYFTDDYGLTYYAAFVGCSAESEASFETVVFLAGKVDELALPAILTLEGNDHALAQTILQNTAAKTAQIVTVDSMQSTTLTDVQAGKTYLGIMEQNLAAFRIALD